MKECALRARSGDAHVARAVVSLVVDAVIGLTLGLLVHVVIVVFVEAMLHRIFCIWRFSLYTLPVGDSELLLAVTELSLLIDRGNPLNSDWANYSWNDSQH